MEKIENQIQEYSVVEFFRDINREISNIIRRRITYRVLSKNFLKMKSKWHVNDKILNSKQDSANIFPWNLIKLYKERLKTTLGSNFNQFKKYFNKLQIYKKNMIKEVIEFNEDYFKSLNTKTKAYFYGWLLAEGHVDKKGRRFIIEINVRDGEILKRFIEAINLNPKKVKFKRREKNGNCFMYFVLEISSEIFVKHLINLGFVRGKKSKKIRFPLSIVQNRGLALACLLGFFDGDGSHGRKYPKLLPENERKSLRPYITSKSVRFLNDVKSIFKIRYNVSGARRLSIGTFLFLEMLENYKSSLDRKRYDGYLSSKDLIKLRTTNLSNSWSIPKRKFKFTENELTSLWEKGWSDEEIADCHEKKYQIKITERTVKHWRFEWKLFHKDPIFKAAFKANLIKKLLPSKEWTLEGIYTRKFGYNLDPSNSRHIYRFKKRLEEWFYNDPLIQGSNDIVEKIKEIYGK
ncbi:MAG: hypothetical protein ACFFAO_14090 [Candidatus Hermodarchaeota archaeon]